MKRNGYCYLRLFNRQYRRWASHYGAFPNARTIMRILDQKVTRNDDRIRITIRREILHVEKSLTNDPAQMTFMVKWAYEHPFAKIGGTEVERFNPFGSHDHEITDEEIEDVQSPSSTIIKHQFQRLAPLRGDAPRSALQGDTVMIDAPSIYDEQLAVMIKQVQNASLYLYKLSGQDRENAYEQYTRLMNITEDVYNNLTKETSENRHLTAAMYEEFHKGSINFAKQVYEKLREHETNHELSKKYSDDLCTAVQVALDGMHRITDETTQRQAEINKEKDAQVNDLNQRLLQQQKEQKELNRKAKEAEKALRHLQLKRTKEQSQSITPECDGCVPRARSLWDTLAGFAESRSLERLGFASSRWRTRARGTKRL